MSDGNSTRRQFVSLLGAAAIGTTSSVGSVSGRSNNLSQEETLSSVLNAANELSNRLGVEDSDDLTVGFERNKGEINIVVHFFRPAGTTGVEQSADPPINGLPDQIRGKADGDSRGFIAEHVSAPSSASREFPVQIRRWWCPERNQDNDLDNRSIGTEDHDLPSGGFYDDPYEPLAGGASIDGCSLGAPAEDPDGNRYAVTAGHCYQIGDTVHQPDGGDPIGEVVERQRDGGIGEMDAALIELNDDVTYDGALAVSDGSSTNQLTGVKSSLQLTLDVMSPLATYSKRGNRTGFTSGMLGGIISHVDLTFWVDANAGPGDSGGPSYELNSSSGEATAAGGVNGAAAALLSDVPQDRSEEEWHQTVYTSYASVEQEFGVEVAPDG